MSKKSIKCPDCYNEAKWRRGKKYYESDYWKCSYCGKKIYRDYKDIDRYMTIADMETWGKLK